MQTSSTIAAAPTPTRNEDMHRALLLVDTVQMQEPLQAEAIESMVRERGGKDVIVWPVAQEQPSTFFVLTDKRTATGFISEQFYNGLQVADVVDRDRYMQTSLMQMQHRAMCQDRHIVSSTAHWRARSRCSSSAGLLF